MKRKRQISLTKIHTFHDNYAKCIYSISVYIGHPAYKRMGARQAYSIINALVLVPLCIFGVIGLLLNVIAVVAVNPTIVSHRQTESYSYFLSLYSTLS